MKTTLSADLMPDKDGGYVAQNPETGTTTQGETMKESLENLRKAIELPLEEFPFDPPGKSFLTTIDVSHVQAS
jgi:predicted RNase H-like HicB family nuclease